MIHAGDRLENPVTGEVLVFHRTSNETDGESVLVETIVRRDGFVAAAHVHPQQTERFGVLEGLLGLRVGDQELVARAGDVALVAPGTPTASGTRVRTRSASSARYGRPSSSSR
jgi:quercetin dioxygenase-like cupin family protein